MERVPRGKGGRNNIKVGCGKGRRTVGKRKYKKFRIDDNYLRVKENLDFGRNKVKEKFISVTFYKHCIKTLF